MIKQFWHHYHYKCLKCGERYWLTEKIGRCVLCEKEVQLLTDFLFSAKKEEVNLNKIDTLLIFKQKNNPEFMLDYFTCTYIDSFGRSIIGCFRKKEQTIKMSLFFGFSGKNERITFVENNFLDSIRSIKVLQKGIGWEKLIDENIGN